MRKSTSAHLFHYLDSPADGQSSIRPGWLVRPLPEKAFGLNITKMHDVPRVNFERPAMTAMHWHFQKWSLLLGSFRDR